MIQSSRPTHIEVSTPAPGDGEEISERRAKQGTRGRHILIVLSVSIALVVIAFIGAYALNGRPSVGSETGTAANERVEAFHGPAPTTAPATAQPAS